MQKVVTIACFVLLLIVSTPTQSQESPTQKLPQNPPVLCQVDADLKTFAVSTSDGDVLASIELRGDQELRVEGFVCNAATGEPLGIDQLELIELKEKPMNEVLRRLHLSDGSVEEVRRIQVDVEANGAFTAVSLPPGVYVFKIDWIDRKRAESWAYYYKAFSN